jgi:L-fuculose-phosphate aldolase
MSESMKRDAADVESLRKRVASASRELSSSGLVVAGAGNVSARMGGWMVITPRGCRLSQATPKELVEMALDGDPPAGASSEHALHTAIYAATKAGAVVHTHSHFATVLSATVDSVPAVHYAMVGFGGEVRVARYATFGTAELASNAAEALGDGSAVLLRNHGAVTYGSTVEHALERAVLLEWLCSVAYHASVLGRPQLVPDAELQRVAAQSRRLGYSLTEGD